VSLITFHPNREAMQSTDYATHTTTGERKIRFTVILETEIDKSRLSAAWPNFSEALRQPTCDFRHFVSVPYPKFVQFLPPLNSYCILKLSKYCRF